MIDPILFISGVFFILPTIIQMRNYFLVKSTSYLIFASLFFFATINQLLVSVKSDHLLLQYGVTLSFVSTYLILIYVGQELNDNKLPIKMKSWFIFAFLVFISTIILKTLIFTEKLNSDWNNFRIIIGQIFTITTGIVLIYSIRHFRSIVSTTRTKFIIKAWFITGVIILIAGLIRLVILGSIWFQLVVLDITGDYNKLQFIGDMVGVFSTLILALITAIIALFFPESMLLSHTQILKAARLYELADAIDDDENLEFLSIDTPEALKEYVKMLPRKADIKND